MLEQRELFELYHGPIGNTFRTKYRATDWPFTERGRRDVQAAGIYAIAHGHRNITSGQRIIFRAGMLNLECDASIDANTRRVEGLEAPGAAVTVFRPDGRILGLSTDCPTAKLFDLAHYGAVLTLT